MLNFARSPVPIARSTPMPRSSPTLLTVASVLSLSCALALPAPARAANFADLHVEGAPTVLGIEKTNDADEQAAFDLTEVLRAEMEKQGKGGGADLSLLELRLTMGCDGNEPACLAEGGKTMDASELIYGSVVGTPEGYRVQLSRLDVGTQEVVGSVDRTVDEAKFSSLENLEGLAKELVDEIYGKAPPPAPVPADAELPPESATEEGPQDEPGEPDTKAKAKTSNLVWGKDPDPPKWKYVGLGVSAGLAAASLGTAIGTTIAIGPNGSVRRDLNEAADDSLTDMSTSNDVDRQEVDDVCQFAREEINPVQEPGAVRNADVTQVCDRGDALATTATATWITSGVFLVSTAVFTTLLFVRKDDRAAQTLRHHQVAVGGAPTRDGGMMFGGKFSF